MVISHSSKKYKSPEDPGFIPFMNSPYSSTIINVPARSGYYTIYYNSEYYADHAIYADPFLNDAPFISVALANYYYSDLDASNNPKLKYTFPSSLYYDAKDNLWYINYDASIYKTTPTNPIIPVCCLPIPPEKLSELADGFYSGHNDDNNIFIPKLISKLQDERAPMPADAI